VTARPGMRVEDIAEYRHDPSAFAPHEVYLVVKSQDQLERRRHLIEAVERGRIGRIEDRPVAEGLVVSTVLEPGRRITRDSCATVLAFREPRGLVRLDDGTMLVAEIDRVVQVDAEGSELREYRHPLFAFLHSIELASDRRRLLVVSSGYDALIELDLDSGSVLWEWLSWEHGFNPSEDGVYLSRNPGHHRDLLAKGLPARLIEPSRLGAYGLMTSERTNHPNSACYEPRDPSKVLATLGHSGEVIEIERASGDWRRVIAGLAAMPHGIMPYGEGWMVTDTLRGMAWLAGPDFAVRRKLAFASLPGKPPELGDAEWLQAVLDLGGGVLLALDANRGLILVQPDAGCYGVVPVDENWCVHWGTRRERRH
jgi:hypothetical protein